MKNFLAVLRNRNIGLLLTGRIISSGGDWLYQIALSVAVFQYSGGKSFYVGVLWIVRLVPALVLSPYTGALADRLGYRRTMILADLGRMVVVTVLAAVLTGQTWALIFPLAFLNTCLGVLFRPASVGIIPTLVSSKEERLAANATIMQVESLSGIVGSAVGGVVAGSGHLSLALLIDAVTFACSAASLVLIKPHPPIPKEKKAEAGEDEAEEEEEFGTGYAAGVRMIRKRPLLVFAGGTMALPELASGAIIVWIVPYAEQALNTGNAGVGYLYTALAVGSLVGGFVAAVVGSNFRLDQLLALSVAVGGLSLVIFGSVHVWVVALACMLLVGTAETVEYASYETLLQQAVPENVIGRASGTMDSTFFVMMLVGTAVSGLLASSIGLTASITGLGVLVLIATTVSWINLQHKTSGQPDAATLARIPAFATVPVAVREWAVRRMVRERLPRGTVVIRQGDEGDKFYTIAKGKAAVEISQNGRTMTRELGPGNFFGEIALLHDVPRTATVRAVEPLTVWTMSREDFDELRKRASEFDESLWETATSRLQETTDFQAALAARP